MRWWRWSSPARLPQDVLISGDPSAAPETPPAGVDELARRHRLALERGITRPAPRPCGG